MNISDRPISSTLPLWRMRALGGLSLVVSLVLGTLAYGYAGHLGVGSIAGFSAGAAAAGVLGAYLIVAGNKTRVEAIDFNKKVLSARWVKVTKWVALGLTAIFLLAIYGTNPHSVVQMSAFAACASASFMLFLCMSYERKRKFHEVVSENRSYIPSSGMKNVPGTNYWMAPNTSSCSKGDAEGEIEVIDQYSIRIDAIDYYFVTRRTLDRAKEVMTTEYGRIHENPVNELALHTYFKKK